MLWVLVLALIHESMCDEVRMFSYGIRRVIRKIYNLLRSVLCSSYGMLAPKTKELGPENILGIKILPKKDNSRPRQQRK